MKTWIMGLIVLLTSLVTWGQVNQAVKHPRVLEVEKMLSREGMDFLRARFPGRPFIVSVALDPIHRIKKGETDEVLPYYDMTEEERFDEWDDPSVPAIALLNRVNKISLVITVPADLSEDELTEIKSSIIPNLGMIEARDTVEVRKRTWLSQPQTEQMSWWNVVAYGVMLSLFMMGLFGTALLATSRIAKALKESGPGKSAGGEGGAAVINLPSAPSGEGYAYGGGSGGGMGGTSDVKMLDSLKMREWVAEAIKHLSAHQDFPRMEDMLHFESYAAKNPAEFGALLSEIPVDLRNKIFGYSYSVPWLAAMTEPSDVGAGTIELLQKCIRVHRDGKDTAWQNLLILVWRLNDLGEKFFQGIPQNEAMTIMAHLPKGEGVRWARHMYPGNWGQLLDPGFRPAPLNDIAIQKYSQKAVSILPLRKVDVLQNYLSEKEVLKYVRTAPIQTEKEVYLAAGENSTLRQVRPPFYHFYEMSPDQYQRLMPKFSLEEWATALFNTPKPDRAQFEGILSPKQKTRMYEVFRRLEQKNPNPATVASIRERMGKEIDLIFVQDRAPVEESNPASGQSEAA